MNMTLLQLRSFLAASESLNFSEAALRLRLRQPTLSSNIKSLEAAIGGRLFYRDTHRVTLTELGLACQQHARRLLEDLDRAKMDLRQRAEGLKGSIRLASLPHIFPSLLAQPLARFRELRPEVTIRFEDVSTSEAMELLRAKHIDLAIVNELESMPGIRCQFLTERRFVAVLPQQHPLAAAARIRWAALEGNDLIVIESRELNDSRMVASLRSAGLLPPITHRVHQLSTAVGLVMAGFGIALMAQHTAQHVLQPGLVARPLVEPDLVGKVGLLTLASRQPSPQVRLLCDVLLDACGPSSHPASEMGRAGAGGRSMSIDIDRLDRDIG
jgi:DNA-binding transcriptional LysR family regulator